MGMRQTNRWHWASTFAAVVALATLLPACHCEEQREKGVEILAREYENALACCRKLEDPVAAAECAADMGHRRDCVDLWICEAFKSCKDGRNKGIREFFEALGEFIFRCVGLIRTADGTVLNPVPVLPVDTMSLQLSGSPSSTTCTDASSALLGYRLTGAIALGGIDARFPITMEFAATLPTQGIDEGPTQRIVCCAIRVDIAGEQLNLQRDATNPSYFFMRVDQGRPGRVPSTAEASHSRSRVRRFCARSEALSRFHSSSGWRFRCSDRARPSRLARARRLTLAASSPTRQVQPQIGPGI